jgi:hypothetical protein
MVHRRANVMSEVVDQQVAKWNQFVDWLRRLDAIRFSVLPQSLNQRDSQQLA